MGYVPKSKRERLEDWARNGALKGSNAKDEAITNMGDLLGKPLKLIHELEQLEPRYEKLILNSVMEAAEKTIDKPIQDRGIAQRVFVANFAEALNRNGLLSDRSEQPFREWGYQYMRGFK